jgi:hypothetical protein
VSAIPKLRVEITKTYYVYVGDWIYGGPFYTKEEAERCLAIARQIKKDKPNAWEEMHRSPL